MMNEERKDEVSPVEDVDIKRLRRGRSGAPNNSGDRYFYNVHADSLGAADGWAQNTIWGNRSLVEDKEEQKPKQKDQGGTPLC
ncbi:MAG: hypothetical protein JST80_13275 [Bdellovibrionales bacterium]|nr:hypothetical protein [Bdellovibrionales bacterium]